MAGLGYQGACLPSQGPTVRAYAGPFHAGERPSTKRLHCQYLSGLVVARNGSYAHRRSRGAVSWTVVGAHGRRSGVLRCHVLHRRHSSPLAVRSVD